MDKNVTNLLPPERRRALSRDFILRIMVVSVVLIILLVLTAGIFLIPTYVYLQASVQTKKEHLANVENSLTTSDEAALSARLTELGTNAAKLKSLKDAPSASAIVREVLAIPRAGITLAGFSYAPSGGATLPGTIVISGSSTTRDALRGYLVVLQGAPFARAAVLPVSAYANDTDITFAITITLKP